MDILKIKYFITAAKCLNFSRAADQLYMTQPALSQAIASIEKELNLQLFIRSGHELRLTPAARVLFEEFSKVYDTYESSIYKAANAQYGYSGKLSIGVLDGSFVDDVLPGRIRKFTEKFPFIEIDIGYRNFNEMIAGLYDGSVDIAFTLRFDVEGRKYIEYEYIAPARDCIAVLRTSPLAERDRVKLLDLREETFIMVGYDVSEKSPQLIIDGCQMQGFMPTIRFSPSIYTSTLWVQAGLGVTMLDSRNLLQYNPGVKFLETDQVSDPSLVAAWHSSNTNSALAPFIEMLKEEI
ncbi:MAG: LysR family transcriptional regulator [Clostridiales Family XIII bacterium]|jgi:DNA-binding transcriptional LysR family regulator|nr:LysR family transcriptional regulator [Clostridiales Family XIII bacterium]